jgi:hypothetical protein
MAGKLIRCWLLLFLAFLILRNTVRLFNALVYAQNLNEDYRVAGNLTYLFLVLLLLAVSIWRLRKPFRAFLLWVLALSAALYVPHYEWPQYAWKIAHNKERYDSLIAQYSGSPKLVVLEEEEIPLYTSGMNFTWLLFDENDEITLPMAVRSDQWKKRAPYALTSAAGSCNVRTSKLKEHFFFILAEC